MYRLKAFTLIELLIVIAIIAILGSATVLVLNPVELMKQGRDGTRISDIENIDKAVRMTLFNNTALLDSLPATNIYLSLPSGSCPPNPPAGYTYVCNATAANINKVDGTGWIPLSLQNMASLPVDPGNGSYYAFVADPATKTFVVNAALESRKQTKIAASNDGGVDPLRFEKGNVVLWAQVIGIAGYWPLDEGSGTVAYDKSGNGNNGTWQGTPSGTNGFYSPGSFSAYAGYFNKSNNNYVSIPDSPSLNFTTDYTAMAWFKLINPSGWNAIFGKEYWNAATGWVITDTDPVNGVIQYYKGGGPSAYTDYFSFNSWHHIAIVNSNGAASVYFDGVFIRNTPVPISNSALSLFIGARHSNDGLSFTDCFNGSIYDARIYKRAVSGSEIQSIYNTEK